MKALIVAVTSEDWITAERDAVEFLRRHDLADGLEAVELPSEMENPR